MDIFTLTALMVSLHQPLPHAKGFTTEKKYQESLAVLKVVSPTKEQYNEYCYLMAVDYFALNDRDNAAKWVTNLLESFEPLQSRHRTMAYLMEDSLKKWKSGDLSDIERDMRISGDRLDTTKVGGETQKVQKGIIEKLDKLIHDEEDKKNAKNQPKGGSGQDQGQQQKGGKPQDGQSTQPANESQIVGGAGKGQIDEKKLKKLTENWGTLPPAKRTEIINEITKDLPPKYKPLIESYFKALNQKHPAP